MLQTTLSVEDAARLAGISRTTAYAHARCGRLFGAPTFRVGSRIVIPLNPVAKVLGMTAEEVREALAQDAQPSGDPS